MLTLLRNRHRHVPKHRYPGIAVTPPSVSFRRRLSAEDAKPGSYTMDRKMAQIFVYMFVCFFEDFSTLRAFTEPKVAPYARVVDNTLLGHVFYVPSESVARDRSSRRPNIMVRAIAATFTRELGSDSLLEN